MFFLETQRLIITPPQVEDFENLLLLQSDARVMRYIGKGMSRSEEEVRSGLERAIAHYAKHGFSLGSVFEKASGHFVGRAGLIYLAYDDSQPEIELGYALTKKAWSKGYATELSQALVQWGFDHLGIDKLVAVINPENEASRRVLEKIGMSYVGRIKYNNVEVALYDLHKHSIDVRHITLKPLTHKEYPLVQNMARFYVYDMSECLGDEEGWEIPANGLYECIDFKKYWDDENAFPFLIYYQNELAGFAIIDKKGSEPDIDFNMAEFFILRKFKGRGIGSYVAQLFFDRFQGLWEVMVMPRNEGAYRFWRGTIYHYAHGDVVEYTRNISHHANKAKNIFKFLSRPKY